MSSSQSTRTPTTTSSRKRSHAEITRSESRSSSVEPFNKRRRTHRTPVLSPTPGLSTAPIRHERDGFDFRRPAMSNTNYVDLTRDDDDEEEEEEENFTEAFDFNNDDFLLDDEWLEEQRERSTTRNPQGLDPPAQAPRNLLPNFIDLSNDDEPIYDQPEELPQNGELRRASTSSEVEFLGERTATPQVDPALINRRPSLRDRRPTPGPQRDRRQPQNMAAPPALPGLRALGGIPGLIRRTLFRQDPHMRPDFPQPPIAVAALPDDFEIIDLNYGQAAFQMGDRASETPQATPGDAYKEPEPMPEGFAGDIDEDGVYICPLCDEELATGTSEEKQQVWVAKQCGHVYCGECARRRPVKTGSKRDKKGDFRTCVVDGCGVKVDSKVAMIQVYL